MTWNDAVRNAFQIAERTGQRLRVYGAPILISTLADPVHRVMWNYYIEFTEQPPANQVARLMMSRGWNG